MEKWKKLVNHAIELIHQSDGDEVCEFYKSIGIKNVARFGFCNYRDGGDTTRFYCVYDDGNISNISDTQCKNDNIKIVTLEEAKRIVENDTESFNVPLTKIVGRVVI